MKEFNLSEKRKKLREDLINANWATNTINAIVDEVEKQDKEFIRLLKEGAEENLNPDDAYWFIQFIEKRAGEKLK